MLLNTPKRIRARNGYLMIDIRDKNQRYRAITIYEATEDNIPKAENLLNKIKKDLSKNLFFLANYEKYFKNASTLLNLDAEYNQQAKTNALRMADLIQKEAISYHKRVMKGTLGQATYDNYMYAINLHTAPFFKNYYLHEIDGDILEAFIKKLPFCRKRIELIFRPLRNIFQNAIRKKTLTSNPINEIDPNIYLEICQTSDYEVIPFNHDEICLILENCKHESIRNIIKFGFWTGMRIGEIFALQWSDISFENEAIYVTKTISIKGIIKPPKTKAGIRTLELTPIAKETLISQYNITGEKNDRVFLTPTGRIWKKTSAFRDYWEDILLRASVKYRNPYQMRHTFISNMLTLGNNPMVLYKMVGHENPKIMFEKYARFIKSNSNQKLLITTIPVPKPVPNL